MYQFKNIYLNDLLVLFILFDISSLINYFTLIFKLIIKIF
jgi:hypothetical protein